MTRAERGAIEAAVMNVLQRFPLTIDETTVELHRRDAIPVWWKYANVAAVIRRLHDRGALHRLDAAPSRSVLWWAP